MSSHWAGAVPRFAPEDFCEGERLHERYRWPIAYEDLAPYYERIERLIGVTAARRDVAAQPAPAVAHERRRPKDWELVAKRAEAAGHGFTPLPVAHGPRWAVRRTGVGFNSFTDIVEPLQRSPHFRLLLGSHALRLEWSGDLQRVTSAIYLRPGHNSYQIGSGRRPGPCTAPKERAARPSGISSSPGRDGLRFMTGPQLLRPGHSLRAPRVRGCRGRRRGTARLDEAAPSVDLTVSAVDRKGRIGHPGDA
jgi:choline dehydrogenase-like flavoprotein